jgi:hypothetical protein
VADQTIEEKSRTESDEPPELIGDSRPAPQEVELLVALRRFIRLTSNQREPVPEVTPRIGSWQKLVLLVIALDFALLYLLFQEWFEDPLLLLALKVLPWLLGATVFTYYSDSIQKRIVQMCQNNAVAIFAVLIALPLLLARQPIFSVLVKVDPDTVAIVPDDSKDKLEISQLEDTLFRIVTPNLLKPYRITVRDPATENSPDSQGGFSRPFSPLLQRPQILRATLAQLPLIGVFFGQRQLALSPLYQQPVSSDEDGDHVQIAGTFEEGYLEYLMQLPYANRACNRQPGRPGADEILCSIANGDDALYLPPGRYNITLIRGKCVHQLGEREILRAQNKMIAFGKLCSQ